MVRISGPEGALRASEVTNCATGRAGVEQEESSGSAGEVGVAGVATEKPGIAVLNN
jgi:hypothetical protein